MSLLLFSLFHSRGSAALYSYPLRYCLLAADMGEPSNVDSKAAPPHLQPHTGKPPTAYSIVAADLRQDSDAVACIVCLLDLPQDTFSVAGQYDPVARLVPCNHAMHNSCLVPWMERANSCPICRATFNKVSVSATLSSMQSRFPLFRPVFSFHMMY